MDEIIFRLAELPSSAMLLVVTVTMALDTVPLVGLVVPGDVIVVVAAGSAGPLGSVPVMIGSVLGTMVTWTASFAIGARVGRDPLVRLRLTGSLGGWLNAERIAAAERLLAGAGGRAVLIAQFIPVLNAITPLVAGALRMPSSRFARLALAGSSLWAAAYAGLGLVAGGLGAAYFGESGRVLGPLLGAVPGLLLGWLMLLATRRLRTGSPSPEPVTHIAE